MGAPCLQITEAPGRMLSQDRAQCSREVLGTQIGKSVVVDHVVRMTCPQQVQEIQPALGGGGAEPGKMRVADLSAGAVAPLVPSAGVVGRDPGRSLQARA